MFVIQVEVVNSGNTPVFSPMRDYFFVLCVWFLGVLSASVG